MPDNVHNFNLITGTTTTLSWEARQRYLLECEIALRRVWELSGSFRTDDAEATLVGLHGIAHSILHPDQPATEDA